MKKGTIGALIGVLSAVVLIQWGWLALFLIIVLAGAGYALERWLLPRRQRLGDWLEAGKQALRRED